MGSRRASLVAVVRHPREVGGERLTELDRVADSIEVRGPEADGLRPYELRRRFHGRLVYSMGAPRRADGPNRRASAARPADGPTRPDYGHRDPVHRLRWLLAAADAGYDVVDLHWPGDVTPEVLGRVPPTRRRISWHGAAPPPDRFEALVHDMRSIPASLYLVALDPGPGALAALGRLRALALDDVTAFVTGVTGQWSRVVAPWMGAPVAFGRARSGRHGPDPDPFLDGMPSLADLIADYGLPDLPRLEDLYGIVGRVPRPSLSPLLHNAAYRGLGLPALYLPFWADSFAAWVDEVAPALDGLGLQLRGVTVMAPHKEDALSVADHASAAATRAGAANLLVRRGGRWLADTTDSSAVLAALARAGVDPAGRATVVIGCGGAGRAAASALVAATARVTLVNRSPERGHLAAELLHLPLLPLGKLDPSPYSLVVHATPLQHESPVNVGALPDGAAVLDMVYGTSPTRLVAEARDRDLVTIDGWEVLMAEVGDQFRSMTGFPMPPSVGDGLTRIAQDALDGGRPPGG